jgi:hypothetical protein
MFDRKRNSLFPSIHLSKKGCDFLYHTPFEEFYAGCQPWYPVKIPITVRESLSPPHGLQLYPSCQARCPVKASDEMGILPCPICSTTFNGALPPGTFLFFSIVYPKNPKMNQIREVTSFFLHILELVNKGRYAKYRYQGDI